MLTDHQPAPEAVELPELPEPAQPESEGICCGNFTTGGEYMGQHEELCCGNPDEAWPAYYTADQMRDYAREAVRAALARQAPAIRNTKQDFYTWWEANSERLIQENDPRELTEEGWNAAINWQSQE